MRLGGLPKWVCVFDPKLKCPNGHSLKNFCGSHHEFFTRKRVVPQNRACNVQRAKGGQPYQIEGWNVSASRTIKYKRSARPKTRQRLLKGAFADRVIYSRQPTPIGESFHLGCEIRLHVKDHLISTCLKRPCCLLLVGYRCQHSSTA